MKESNLTKKWFWDCIDQTNFLSLCNSDHFKLSSIQCKALQRIARKISNIPGCQGVHNQVWASWGWGRREEDVYTNNPNKSEIYFMRLQWILRFPEGMDCFSNEVIVERRRAVERLERGEGTSGSQSQEDGAFPLLKIGGNLIDSKSGSRLTY